MPMYLIFFLKNGDIINSLNVNRQQEITLMISCRHSSSWVTTIFHVNKANVVQLWLTFRFSSFPICITQNNLVPRVSHLNANLKCNNPISSRVFTIVINYLLLSGERFSGFINTSNLRIRHTRWLYEIMQYCCIISQKRLPPNLSFLVYEL